MPRISTLANPRDGAGVSFVRHAPQRIFKTSLVLLLLAFFSGAVAAQTRSWPIVNGRRPQPTQQQIDSREANAARQWNRRFQSQVDHLYDKIMHAAVPSGR